MQEIILDIVAVAFIVFALKEIVTILWDWIWKAHIKRRAAKIYANRKRKL